MAAEVGSPFSASSAVSLMRSGHRGSGPIVTSNLAAGNRARVAVGIANAAEFLVALAESAVFLLTIGFTQWTIIVGLVTGGFVAAPYVGGISSIGILNVNQGVLRTPVLRAVGGFSEPFGDYGIDPDLTAKVLFSGHAIVYTRAVAIHHSRNWPADLASPQFHVQMEKQRTYQKLYADLYAPYAQGGIWVPVKRWIWKAAARLFRKRGSLINSADVLLGASGRDWYNILHARYISVFDPLWNAGKSYHLVQCCPQRRREQKPLPSGMVSSVAEGSGQ